MPAQNSSSASTPESPMHGHAAAQWLLGITLVFAPLFRSGQPALAVLTLELLATTLLFVVLWWPRQNLVTGKETLILTLLLVFPLLYLMPLPTGMTSLIPGWQPYMGAYSLLGSDTPIDRLTLSVYPLRTESALLLLLLPVSVFLATRILDTQRIFQLVLLLLGIAAVQAFIGLLQYGAGEGSPALLGMSFSDARSASGTYTNRNHLAGLLEMVLPIALALAFFTIGRNRSGHRLGWRGKFAFLASMRGHTAFIYVIIALVILLGVIFTRSRAGISLSMLGIIVTTLLFARRIGGDNVYGTTGTVIAIALGGALAIGLIPVLDRFSVGGAIQDARWPIFSATLDGIGAFAPFGSGFGNYPEVFPSFQPLELGRWFINHAHNDYLEWLFEGGIFSAALIMLFLVLYTGQWGHVWRRGAWSRFRFVQVACGIGLLLLMLHSLVDYNLQTPANIAYFAFLAGIFFAAPAEEAGKQFHRKRKQRRTPNLTENSAAPPVPVREQPVSPPDQIRNPFLDS